VDRDRHPRRVIHRVVEACHHIVDRPSFSTHILFESRAIPEYAALS